MCLHPIVFDDKHLKVNCGRCLPCRIRKSEEWAARCALEAQLHDNNCMLTLTYDNEHLPSDRLVSKRDLQLFIKRLRKAIAPVKIKYFACGEYGSRFSRPHYHILIFGWRPDDLVLLSGQNDLFNSAFVFDIWKKGFVSVGLDVSAKSARYVAKYFQKNIADFEDGKNAFLLMSNKPGIGLGAVRPEWLRSGKMYVEGRVLPLPRYFLESLSKDTNAFISVQADSFIQLRRFMSKRSYWRYRLSLPDSVTDESIRAEAVKKRLSKVYDMDFVSKFDQNLT